MNFGADLIFFFFLAFLVFGPKKLPEIARLVGKTMGELRRASNEFRFSLEEEIRNAELAEEAKKAQATLTAHSTALPSSPEALPAAAAGAVEKDWEAENDLAWRDVEGLREHGDADADDPEGRGWTDPELGRAAAGTTAAGEMAAGAEDGDPAAGSREASDAEPEPPAAGAEPHGGVPGTVPASERPWTAPERRT